ncbi:chitin synthase activator (Chs3), putative [Paecilomyces variotii No. 5]|uniref:Chitin synthase activator (Chs3), putative n=1 Tax=Byssochlamys spectabilis (strain No. 5 / NBRC 109023) TaxID=1356009 RepID=V5FIR6_BYSSN|nr:chitin synthase activator (Chs3), putative [Paecilomyces variotii No. 5]
MAYPQRAPPQRPPPTRQYDNPYPQAAGWQGPPQNGYDQGYQDYGYDNHGGYGDAGYGGQQAYPPRSQSRPQRGGYGGPPDPYGYDGRGNPGGRRPPPGGRGGRPMNRPPPQGRMRPSPGGPPPNGYPDRRKGPPIERQMAGMDLNDRSPPVRPPDRPHTSHSTRSDSSRQHSSPREYRSPRDRRGPPPAGYGTPRGRPERPYVDPNVPPVMPQAKRSATMPIESPTHPGPYYPGQSTYQEHTPTSAASYTMDPYGQPPPVRPSTTTGYRPNPSTVPRTDAAGYLAQPAPTDDKDASDDDFLDHYFDSAEGDEHDMPNFDAMPANPQTHQDHLIPGVEDRKPPGPAAAQSGGQYAAYNPGFSAQAHKAQSQPDLRSNHHNELANAGFQFDLPNDPNGYGDPMDGQYPPGTQGPPMPMYDDGYGGYGSPPQQYGGPMQNNGSPRPYRSNQPGMEPQEFQPMDPQNPDALPAHPTPFRPGLDKPAPVRQYGGPAAGASGPNQTPPQPMPGVEPDSGPVTQQELERLQLMVRSHPEDQKLQLTLAKKMAEASTVLVNGDGMLDAKGKTKAREKYIMDAYKMVKKLIQAGNAEAMFYLADCYGQGQLGLEVDPKEAFHLYQSAAKQGHAESAYRVAVCCELGQEEGGGTRRDPFKAVQWYKRAASLGNTPAMYKMGMILLKGLLGQQKTPREAISWLKRAAERADEENPHALHELGLLYESAGGNDVVIRDEEYSRQLFHQAADLGYKFSQFRLGSAYEYGLMGCPVDARQSIIWYTRAAAQGEHQSELALSGWYLTGAEGILQQSDTEAYLWARKAASAGLAKAEYAMGYFTEVGIGVVSNLDDAKRWYWRAASQNFDKARERLEDLKKGGGRIQKTRVSRSNVTRQNEGDCIVM